MDRYDSIWTTLESLDVYETIDAPSCAHLSRRIPLGTL